MRRPHGNSKDCTHSVIMVQSRALDETSVNLSRLQTMDTSFLKASDSISFGPAPSKTSFVVLYPDTFFFVAIFPREISSSTVSSFQKQCLRASCGPVSMMISFRAYEMRGRRPMRLIWGGLRLSDFPSRDMALSQPYHMRQAKTAPVGIYYVLLHV